MTSASSFKSTYKKVLSLRSLSDEVRRLKREGKRIVFTNGCFDILHSGHIALLEKARSLGDVLIVGINSDDSVRAIKGPARPIVSQAKRARVMAALECVSYITVFDEHTPLKLIKILCPDILVKGSDWPAKEIIGRDVLEKSGGRVIRIPMVKGESTTGLIQRILSAKVMSCKNC